MQVLRRFLSPGWVIGLLAVALFAWACFAVLAPWQLGKSDDLDARNERLSASLEADPAPLAEVVDTPAAFAEREWRLVTVDGTWRPGAEALLRLRSVEGEPVYQVLAVFRLAEGSGITGGGDLLVNRGWVPVGENNTVPDLDPLPEGAVSITARVRAAESGRAEPVTVDGYQAVRVVDPVVIGAALDHTLVPEGYLQLAADQPGSLAPVPIPSIENGPYLSYGLQWLLFGVLAPAALLYFAWSEVRTRRRVAAAEVTEEDGREGPDDEVGAPRPEDDRVVAPENAVERAMRDRYGDRYDAEERRAFKRRDRLRG